VSTQDRIARLLANFAPYYVGFPHNTEVLFRKTALSDTKFAQNPNNSSRVETI